MQETLLHVTQPAMSATNDFFDSIRVELEKRFPPRTKVVTKQGSKAVVLGYYPRFVLLEAPAGYRLTVGYVEIYCRENVLGAS